MSDVWAINILPVIKKQPEGKAGAPSTWSDEQLRMLVELRDVRRKEWGEIARALNRPLSSCHRRYEAITRYREPSEPKSLSAATPRRKPRFHEELGIKSYSVWTTVVDAGGKIRTRKITLSAGITP